MARLSTYYAKRNFAVTPEPRGKVAREPRKKRRFVIQRHDATRLHYDLRLELDGVYRSWAVTKVPSLDPSVKRLAVEVEDHPIEYGTFEGIIPEGEYGGGTVQLWDRGTWTPQSDRSPAKDLAEGHLKIVLDGERMKGKWALVRLRDKDESPRRKLRHNWLLIKEKDDQALYGEPDALLAADTSVKTGRTLAEIAKRSPKVWHSNRGAAAKDPPARPKAPKAATPRTKRARAKKTRAKAKKAKSPESYGRPARMPGFIAPELCRVTSVPPHAQNWVHEVKFDGYRTQLHVQDGKATLYSRKGLDWTHRFPEIALDARGLPDCIMDGEIVAPDAEGGSDFAALQDALSTGKTSKLIFYLFDLMYLEGRDLRAEPLLARKAILEEVLSARHMSDRLRFVGHVETGGKAMLDAACKIGLEGIISKRADAPYRSERGGDWLKSKCRGGQEVVIGGWSAEGSRLRSLLVGMFKNGKLDYAGRVGTGYSQKTAGDLVKKLRAIERPTMPFAQHPDIPRSREVHWVEPKLVAEVEFETVTASGLLRQASFKGLREDKPAKSVVREAQPAAEMALKRKTSGETVKAKTAGVAVCGITITHPEKALWPKAGREPAVTKEDLAHYYALIADRILPHIARRPISVVRAPDGIGGQRFYQRHMLEGVPYLIPIKSKGEPKPYLAIDSVEGLVALGQSGVLEIHPWGCKKDDPETPERIIFDIDPEEGLPFSRVIDAAKELKTRLEQVGLEPFVKTTGGKGLHVVTAVKTARGSALSWPDVKTFAHDLVLRMEKDSSALYVTNMSKKLRKGKIFLDYLRNDKTATGVGPWSPRARPGATVAMPLLWREVSAALDPRRFTVFSAKKDSKRADPWQDLAASAGSLEAARKKLEKM